MDLRRGRAAGLGADGVPPSRKRFGWRAPASGRGGVFCAKPRRSARSPGSARRHSRHAGAAGIDRQDDRARGRARARHHYGEVVAHVPPRRQGRRADVHLFASGSEAAHCRRPRRWRIPATISSCRWRRGCRARRSMPTRMAAGLPPIAGNAPLATCDRRPCRSEDDPARADRRDGAPRRRRQGQAGADASRNEGGVARGPARRCGIRNRIGVQGRRDSCAGQDGHDPDAERHRTGPCRRAHAR